MVAFFAAALVSSQAAEPMVFRGMCDASAVAALDEEFFVVADDEDNSLRVYSRANPGLPQQIKNLSVFLGMGRHESEADLEGAARSGDRIYWISSHGANANGKVQINRHQFFATTGSVKDGRIELEPIGRPYSKLLQDLSRIPELVRFNLGAAAERPPKSSGALNIEGLSSTPEGHLLIGFRNPIPQSKALLVPLLNPADLIAGRPGRFGSSILLELDGLGIRSIEYREGRYLIIAGSHDGDGPSRLYEWGGGAGKPRLVEQPELSRINPEAITFFAQGGTERLWVISDDGSLKVGGVECKRLKDPNQKFFRAISIDPRDLAFGAAPRNARHSP
jgi:hypothetical protein